MTYKQIENSRNKRLWLTQVLIPVASIATYIGVESPRTREAVVEKVVQLKNSAKQKIFKKESKNKKKTVISLDAKNRDEALLALEVLKAEILKSESTDQPIKKQVKH